MSNAAIAFGAIAYWILVFAYLTAKMHGLERRSNRCREMASEHWKAMLVAIDRHPDSRDRMEARHEMIVVGWRAHYDAIYSGGDPWSLYSEKTKQILFKDSHGLAA